MEQLSAVECLLLIVFFLQTKVWLIGLRINECPSSATFPIGNVV